MHISFSRSVATFKYSRRSCICEPLMHRYQGLATSCVGVTWKCCLPTYWTLVFSVRGSLVLLVSPISLGTKQPLCVWGFHPVTQGARCVCVCGGGGKPRGIGCEVSSVTWHKRKPSPQSTQVPFTARKWVKIILATRLPHTLWGFGCSHFLPFL